MSLIVALAFISIGLWLQYWAWRQKKTMHRSQRWPRATGKVLVSEIREARPNQDEYTTLHFIYSFVVKAQTYTGEKLNHFALEQNMSLEEMQAFIQKYPIQAPIQITYNPEDPADCVLLPNEAQGSKERQALALILLTLGVLMLCLTWS